MSERKVEEVRIETLKPGDCFEDDYETGYTVVGPNEKDGERMIESKVKYNGQPMLWYPESHVYHVTYD